MLTKTTMLVMALTANVLCDDFCDDKVDKGVFGLCKLWTKNAALLDRLRELLGMSAAGDLRVLLTGPTMSCSKLFLENEDMRADCEKSYSDQQFAPFMIQRGGQSYLVALARKDLPSLPSIKAYEGEIVKQRENYMYFVYNGTLFPGSCIQNNERCFQNHQLVILIISKFQQLTNANAELKGSNRDLKTEFYADQHFYDFFIKKHGDF